MKKVEVIREKIINRLNEMSEEELHLLLEFILSKDNLDEAEDVEL